MSPSAYRRLTLLAALALAVIIVTGALVRLTGSGLGCPDWPQCNETRFVDVSSTHGAIEQVNRLFTGLVAVAVVLAVLGSLVRRPRRRDLLWLSIGLVAGVIGQIVLGGITVLTDLHPASVQAHFVLSIVILTDALVLHQRASEEPGPYRPAAGRPLRREVAGRVGPRRPGDRDRHRGDGDRTARRGRGGEAVRVRDHRRRPHPQRDGAGGDRRAPVGRLARPSGAGLGGRRRAARRAARSPLVVQGTIGYMQYFNGIPVPLVALHVTGSVVVWWLACRLTFATRAAGARRRRPRQPRPTVVLNR